MGNGVSRASWIGKAAYEIGVVTGRDGASSFRLAENFAEGLRRQGLALDTHDPRATMREFYGVNDDAAEQPSDEALALFRDFDLIDLNIDISGANGSFTLLVADSRGRSLEAAARIETPYSLAHGLHDALAGGEWWLDGVARVRAVGDWITVQLAQDGSGMAAVTLTLTRNGARGFARLLSGSAGHTHRSRFTTRGFWYRWPQQARRAA